MQLGFIGTGAISTAVIEGIVSDQHTICISKRSLVNSVRLSETYQNISTNENQGVIDNSKVVFIGLTVDKAELVLKDLNFRKNQRVVSFMAAVSEKKIKELVFPAKFESIMIPWPAIKNKNSPVLCWPNSVLIQEIFGKENNVIQFDDFLDFERYLIAQAVLSPILQMTKTALHWLAAKASNDNQADDFLRSLISSTLQSDNLSEGIKGLSTKGGLNETLRMYLGEKGLYSDLKVGLDILYKSRKE